MSYASMTTRVLGIRTRAMYVIDNLPYNRNVKPLFCELISFEINKKLIPNNIFWVVVFFFKYILSKSIVLSGLRALAASETASILLFLMYMYINENIKFFMEK